MTGAAPEAGPAALAAVESVPLDAGWELAALPAGAELTPDALARARWVAAQVPGTVAGALRTAGLWQRGEGRDFDAEDWVFRTRIKAPPAGPGERLVLVLEGIATVARVLLDGRPVLETESMWEPHELDITEELGPEGSELLIHCLALRPLLAVARRPRARWRTRLVPERNLRFYRTMLLGRALGIAAEPAAVGPYRPVWIERRRGVAVAGLRLRATASGTEGRLTVQAVLDPLEDGRPVRSVTLELEGPDGEPVEPIALAAGEDDGARSWRGAGTVPGPELWWPHTHGTPALYGARLRVAVGDGEVVVAAGRIGFRRLESAGDPARDGVSLRVNGVEVFARGAVWTPVDPVTLEPAPGALRRVLEAACAAGMNMIRIPGTATYESDAFHDLCDELGILVWQDFMFANFDYPDRDEGFMARVREEARTVLERLGGHPSLAVICGGSEVAQQAAMMGVAPEEPMEPLFGRLLPDAVRSAEIDAPYVPSSPWGGELPFRPGQGVAHYYGVGAYRRPFEDVRRAGVRFAAECLAFANLPDGDDVDGGALPGNEPAFMRGVPRDAGASWDFADVRDHYLRLLFGVDPAVLRSEDPDRYVELSRAVSGEVMAEVMGEWRRAGSSCAGALVLWLKDLEPGAGWGVLDHRGRPKVAYHWLRRALAPLAVWSTDEGLDGVAVHVANDGASAVAAVLRIALYRDRETLVEELRVPLELAPRSRWSANVEALLGRFADLSYAYRFGAPAQDLIAFTLEGAAGEPLSEAVRHPAGRPNGRETAAALGLSARLERDGDDGARLHLCARRFLYGVRVDVPDFLAEDDAFSLLPGRPRTLALRRIAGESGLLRGQLSALGLAGRLPLAQEPA